ncbi:MAG: ATP-binding cassette domain-containing protein [Planctomycetota bacterium]|nr:ATP-binding cassette domain-containing protein [Planctomycetota bacterium]
MIEVKNLTKRYGQVLAVDRITFEVAKGSIVGFLGPNGAGKSTTLKIMTCYLPATSGKVTVGGLDVLTQSLEVRRKVGYMPEAVPLYPGMRVREYLMFRAALRDVPARARKAAVARVAKQCWLSEPDDMMRRRLGELSRGYKQRVGLADVLLHDPEVLVLDEPTIGLDPAQIRAMRELITSLRGEHTVILSSHILAEVEQTCDQLVIISGGRLVARGTPQELRRQVAGPTHLLAEVRGAPESEVTAAVKALAKVRAVAADGREAAGESWLRLKIDGEEGSDLRAELFRLVAQKGWQLRELTREVSSLEDFFVQITYKQNVGQ